MFYAGACTSCVQNDKDLQKSKIINTYAKRIILVNI